VNHARVGICLLGSAGAPSSRAVYGVTIAMDVASHLNSYTRLQMPSKPLVLDYLSEDDLLDRLQSSKQGDVALAAFGAWRCAVLGVESANSWRCEVVIRCANSLDSIVEENPAHREDLNAMDAFLLEEWSVDSRPTNWLEISERAHQAAVDYRTLSLSLRLNRRTIDERMGGIP
jgi:hypothetical protein